MIKIFSKVNRALVFVLTGINYKLIRRQIILPCLIVIQSCSSTPESRPKAIIDAEYYQQQGTAAYYNDEFPLAANSFTQALKIYQSIDSESGMLDSYINLLETSIAIGNMDMAHRQLQNIESMATVTSYEQVKIRILLLKVKLLFIQQDYAQAIIELQPVLPIFNQQQQIQNKHRFSLNILSSMARLMVISNHQQVTLWLQRLQLAITRHDQPNTRYTTLLLRLQALQKQREGKFADSKLLLNQALSIYHQQAYRRGIAATLQQLASLESLQGHWQLADELLQRALKIHLWTLNQLAAVKVLEQLIEVNTKLENKTNTADFTKQLNKLTTE